MNMTDDEFAQFFSRVLTGCALFLAFVDKLTWLLTLCGLLSE